MLDSDNTVVRAVGRRPRVTVIMILALVGLGTTLAAWHPWDSRRLPEAIATVEACPSPSGGLPLIGDYGPAGPLVELTRIDSMQLCPATTPTSAIVSKYFLSEDESAQMLSLLESLPQRPASAACSEQHGQVFDVVLESAAQRAVLVVEDSPCGAVFHDGATRFGGGRFLERIRAIAVYP